MTEKDVRNVVFLEKEFPNTGDSGRDLNLHEMDDLGDNVPPSYSGRELVPD